jgi:hypothetical protein
MAGLLLVGIIKGRQDRPVEAAKEYGQCERDHSS